jgi:hypothetical protein
MLILVVRRIQFRNKLSFEAHMLSQQQKQTPVTNSYIS